MNNSQVKSLPDQDGFYGEFGGSYVPEMLQPNIDQLNAQASDIIRSDTFQKKFQSFLRDYVGRPTPLYLAQNLSEIHGAKIYLKREDLCHTGAHKINNAIGQVMLAQSLGKTRIIAETGAGQHGVATATACALLKLPCIVYMGEEDIRRQSPNVLRMEMLGAEVRAATSGSKTLKDATNEALRDWIANPRDTHYVIGSAVGPHPFPRLVTEFQSVIGTEIRAQLAACESSSLPDYVVACIGGGSNAVGAFYEFIDDPAVKLIGVEAAGKGIDSKQTAATLALGTSGVLHGSKTLMLQTPDGQVQEAYSISAGLDYPGTGPLHAHLLKSGRAEYFAVTDEQALTAAKSVAKEEGIIVALETAHAFAWLHQHKFAADDVVVLNLSGRGDKDLDTYQANF